MARITVEALRKHGLTLPGTREDFPWGELVLKVKDKVFAFLGKPGSELKFSVKLPESGARLLDQPFAEPTGYGLGKSGWVSLSYGAGDAPELAELCAWIEESYRAVAPKTLLRELDARSGATPAKKKAPAKQKTPAKKKPAARKKS